MHSNIVFILHLAEHRKADTALERRVSIKSKRWNNTFLRMDIKINISFPTISLHASPVQALHINICNCFSYATELLAGFTHACKALRGCWRGLRGCNCTNIEQTSEERGQVSGGLKDIHLLPWRLDSFHGPAMRHVRDPVSSKVALSGQHKSSSLVAQMVPFKQ